MTLVTLSINDFAALLRTHECVCVGNIGGYLYAVVRGVGDENIYRTAVS